MAPQHERSVVAPVRYRLNVHIVRRAAIHGTALGAIGRAAALEPAAKTAAAPAPSVAAPKAITASQAVAATRAATEPVAAETTQTAATETAAPAAEQATVGRVGRGVADQPEHG